jgi:hypothetical protein
MKIEQLTDLELADIDNKIHSSGIIESINVGKMFAGKKFSVRGKKFFYFHDATQYARNLILSEQNKKRWRENQLRGIANTQNNLEAQKLSEAAENNSVGWQTNL